MSLDRKTAEGILRTRLDVPINPILKGKRKGEDNKKVLGFRTPAGKVLALDEETDVARVWYEPPAPREDIDGVTPIGSAKNDNLKTPPLTPLCSPNTPRIEVRDAAALERFLDWYALPVAAPSAAPAAAGAAPPAVLPTLTAEPSIIAAAGGGSTVPIDGREQCIIEMCRSVENTVKNANGQTVERVVKNKELRMSQSDLAALIPTLLALQHDRCALSGLPLKFDGTDKNLTPSLDRIDSDGHYEHGNLQVVCQFINFWKSDGDNAEFVKCLNLVRTVEI